jgi:hypothetical protein
VRKTAILFFFFISTYTFAQKPYWQQKVNYVIDVTLNDKEKTVDAFERITYVNNSSDTLQYIWFHVWPNAYKNDKTAFSEQLLKSGNTAFYFSNKEQKGYINRLDFKVDGTSAKIEDHPQHIDIVKLVLPKPLPPKGQATITTPFHVKLPFNFSRGGYDGQSFQLTQWYPKPAVYDRKGWHPIPYLDQGEFYSEFGSFDVRITLPKDYVVAATGELQNAEEKEWLKSRKTYELPKTKKITTSKNAVVPKAKPSNEPVLTKTLRYLQDNVHDFAWFANKNFIVDQDTCLIENRVVEVYTFYTPEEKQHWSASLKYAKDALHFYSSQVGAYPYKTASVVQGPPSFGGGMEYPTITIISPMSSDRELDVTIAHELGHNWFYGIIASNERQYPWMDEGMNSFYENKYSYSKYGPQSKEMQIALVTKEKRKTDQPINTTADSFSYFNYGLVAYTKTADWMALEEERVGEEKFKQLMQTYYQQWSFKHPQPEDFKAIMQEGLKEETENTFALLNEKGTLPNEEYKGFKVLSPLKFSSIKNYLQHPTKDALIISPAIGYNVYDRFMIGALLTNYKLPPNNFQFFAAGLYGTGSKRLNEIGKINFDFYPKKVFRLGQVFVNGSTFSMDEFKDTADRKIYMAFEKLVPGIRLVFKEKDPRSSIRKYIQWKTFLINEQGLRIKQDSVFTGTDTALVLRYNKVKQSSTIHQFQFVIDNARALYPYNIKLQVENATDFIRPTLDINYFFNYAKGGGLDFRFFAGKFIYVGEKTISKQFATDRYHLNMTGANGYEDYTYSHYFLGRNRFEGLPSQQVAIRDGGFKVRTDLLADKVGKTDDWLIALNLNSTVPDGLNPLSVLPIKIPLHVFADIGTNAEGWKRNAENDRFLFDAGLHVPLLQGTINIYIPVLYSKVYGDYFKSTIPDKRFLKTITFTINAPQKALQLFKHQAEF